MRVAERVDRDAGGEIEIALAVGGDEPRALAALESEVDTRDRSAEDGDAHGTLGSRLDDAPEMKCAASPGGTFKHCRCVGRVGQHKPHCHTLADLESAKMDIAGENGGSDAYPGNPELLRRSHAIL